MIFKKWKDFNPEKFWKVSNKWGKVVKNGPSESCGRQPLKKLKWNGLLMQTISL